MKWVNPLYRSFNAIKAKLVDGLKKFVPEVTDFTDNNFLVIIISQFASVAEVIHFYIDNIARESFFSTARRLTSVVKHTNLIDYNIKSATPATVDVIVTFENSSGVVNIPVDGYKIPKGTIFRADAQAGSSNTIDFVSTKDIIGRRGDSYISVPCVQEQDAEQQSFGPLSDPANTMINIINEEGLYVEGSMSISLLPDIEPSDESWVLVPSFYNSWEYSKHFKVLMDMSTSLIPSIVFGDGINGALPKKASFVIANYKITKAEAGNVPSGSIFETTLATPSWATSVSVNNPQSASGGKAYEDMDSIKFHAPLYFRSMETCITKRDYEDTAMLVPGVNKAHVKYTCGKYVEVYISPDNDGSEEYSIASSALLESVDKELNRRKIVTTNIEVRPVGVCFINLSLKVTGKTGVKSNDIFNYTNNALLSEYSYSNSEINRAIRVSDIYALVDNLPQVDYLDIESISVTPYVRPSSPSTPLIDISITNKINSRVSIQITVRANTSNQKVFALTQFNIVEGEFGKGQVYDGMYVSILFNSDPETYNIGDTWSFITYNENGNIFIDDNTIPILLSENLTINTEEKV